MDPSMYPDSFHPIAPDRRHDWKGKARHYTRTQCPPKYYLIDFGLSHRYTSEEDPPLRLPAYGGDKSAPEHETYDTPCDPFPTDVYYLGNLVREMFMKVCSLCWMFRVSCCFADSRIRKVTGSSSWNLSSQTWSKPTHPSAQRWTRSCIGTVLFATRYRYVNSVRRSSGATNGSSNGSFSILSIFFEQPNTSSCANLLFRCLSLDYPPLFTSISAILLSHAFPSFGYAFNHALAFTTALLPALL